ncbi:SNF2 helicase associated domain-containing protein [Paenibacillus sp. GCM10027627]|uniref:DEAD/DEAH box helicase n=1 Tax=unclassified Paenibacillus TaxID=185978 RepID=UPI00363584CF
MSFPLTPESIIRLTGYEAYSRGAALAEAGFVELKRPSRFKEEYRAKIIGGSRVFEASIQLEEAGGVHAECSCLAFYTDRHYCKHVAAALVQVMKASRAPEQKPVSRDRGKVYLSSIPDYEVVEGLLDLFQHGSGLPSGATVLRDEREPLPVEFVCRFIPIDGGKHRIGLELKAGKGRMAIVQQPAEWLTAIEQGQAYPLSKSLLYDPSRHIFTAGDHEVIKALIRLHKQEASYRETVAPSPSAGFSNKGIDSGKIMPIPPYAWESLFTALQGASQVRIEPAPSNSGKRLLAAVYSKIEIAKGKPPLHFKLDRSEADDGYELTAAGLTDSCVLDAYGMLFMEGVFYPVGQRELQKLAGLKAIIGADNRESGQTDRLVIDPRQMESIMERVVPGLMKLGYVQISETISNRFYYSPLQARMYLDRLRGKLLAGLEFQYGDIVVNPLDLAGKPRGEERILMRDSEKERTILALMEDERFLKTEGGYLIEGDDAEYDFLHHLVPQLEQYLVLYATSAVKLRMATDLPPMKLHIAWEERTDWLHYRFEMDGITEKEIRAIVKAVKEKRRYYKMATGALLSLETEEFEALLRVMNGVGLHQPALFDESMTLHAAHALALVDMRLRHPVIKMNRSLREMLDNMKHPDQLDFPVPERLSSVLRDYQKYGFQWMKTVAAYRFGGILADEMGLGKTVQSIAFLLSEAESIRSTNKPALIVAPASLLYNWRSELAKFAPELRTVVADGSKEERKVLLDNGGGNDAAEAFGEQRPDVIITSYPLLRKDSKSYSAKAFHTIILDEAQMFKNDTTQTAKAVRSLSAIYRFALTGTPIENRLEELWSIFRAVFPELLPGKREFGEMTREEVARRCRPFLLRRLKEDVLKELPEKIETVHSSELLPEQKKLYAAYLAKLRQDSLKHLDRGNDGTTRIKLLAGITRLRQLCCHPALFVDGYGGSSAKFEQLLELVEECIRSRKRALIFSQFTEMLDLVKRELGYRGVRFFYLDGSTPPVERLEMCNRFNAGERELFLLSLKAGGTGLNLTGADTVILYDLWWNPAVEQQAADRAHRIGQKNVVQVIRLVAAGTVEDKMYELQQRKKGLIDDIVDPGSDALSALSIEDLQHILSHSEL